MAKTKAREVLWVGSEGIEMLPDVLEESDLGVSVRRIEDAGQALKALRERPYGFIVIHDLMGVNGGIPKNVAERGMESVAEYLLTQTRRKGPNKETGIVMACSMPNARDIYLAAGANDAFWEGRMDPAIFVNVARQYIH